MAKKKSNDNPKSSESKTEDIPKPKKKHILKQKLNGNYGKGDEVPEEIYFRLKDNGFGFLFE